MTILSVFSKLANHQIRHQAKGKMDCQTGDCWWSLWSSSVVCVAMYWLIYSLYHPQHDVWDYFSLLPMAQDLTLVQSQSVPLGTIQRLSAAYANQNSTYFIPPGTHYCCVNRVNTEREVCLTLLHMNAGGNQPQTFEFWAQHLIHSATCSQLHHCTALIPTQFTSQKHLTNLNKCCTPVLVTVTSLKAVLFTYLFNIIASFRTSFNEHGI